MARKKRNNLDRLLERFASNLLFEATGGSIGVKPRAPKVVLAEGQHPPTLQEKRALLDSLIKLRGLDEKYKDDDDSGSGLADMRRRLNGTSGEAIAGGSDPAPEAGDTA